MIDFGGVFILLIIESLILTSKHIDKIIDSCNFIQFCSLVDCQKLSKKQVDKFIDLKNSLDKKDILLWSKTMDNFNFRRRLIKKQSLL